MYICMCVYVCIEQSCLKGLVMYFGAELIDVKVKGFETMTIKPYCVYARLYKSTSVISRPPGWRETSLILQIPEYRSTPEFRILYQYMRKIKKS